MIKCDVLNSEIEFEDLKIGDTFICNFNGENQLAMCGIDSNEDKCLIILCGLNQGLVTWDSRFDDFELVDIKLINLKVTEDKI